MEGHTAKLNYGDRVRHRGVPKILLQTSRLRVTRQHKVMATDCEQPRRHLDYVILFSK